MKIQELAIIFVIIILPISLLLSEYTQFQIQTISIQTEYDATLTAATYDAIKAFQLNSANSTTSDLANSKLRDLEASVESFKNSVMSGFKLNGYSEEDLNNYIPALVYTLYDGFYIYSPYENTHDEEGNRITGDAEAIYGLKPYINYSCRYVKGNIDVVITYALDNYITVQGKIGDKYVNKSGYLIDGIIYKDGIVTYNNEIRITSEQLKEYLPIRKVETNQIPDAYPYVKINGTKYYKVDLKKDVAGDDTIIYILNGKYLIQCQKTNIPEGEEPDQSTQDYEVYSELIDYNNQAIQYYKRAAEFTNWIREESGLENLVYGDAVNENGKAIWENNNTKIFKDATNNIENKLSNFNQHRLAVIRHKIETNLAVAISNYNSYSGAATYNVFQMPELKEDEWEHITNNISLISFLQGLPIGGKIYNGYSLVTNSESKEVVLEENIYILGDDNNYHKIGDNLLGTDWEINSGSYGGTNSAGRLNLDFERISLTNDIQTYYYYPLKAYNASYNSIVMQNDVTTYDDIYAYVNSQNNDVLKKAFYTALGRERASKYNSNVIVDTDFLNGEKYTIKYDANGGTEAPSSQTKVEGIDLYLSTEVPRRDGYAFEGWSTVKDTTEVKYEAGDIYMHDADVTLYAVWTINTYTVRYIANNAYEYGYEVTNVPEPVGVTHGQTIIIDGKEPEIESQDFFGWSTSPEAIKVEYKGGDTYPKTGGITEDEDLYAVWKRKTYTITYNANGGSGAPDEQTKTYGEDLTLSSTKPTRSGYDFTGWSTSESGSVQYQPGGTYKENAATTLYAVWSRITYTITYNANGGSGAPGAQTKYHGTNLTLSSTKPTRSGYNFTGWSTSASGSVQYQPGGTYTTDANATLYAVWTRITYTITYNANGGSGAPGAQTKYHGTNLTLSSTKPTRSGYNFTGWSTSASGSVQYQPGGTYTTDANATLYAVWSRITYTVSYNANGGSGAPSSQTKYHGTSLILSSKAPTRTSYTFQGWSESSTATTVTYKSGGTYTENKSTTLYAVWKKVSVTGVSINQTSAQWIPKTTYGSVNNYITLTATVTPSNALNTNVTWSSSNTSVATVNSSGKVTAKAPGKTTITVTSSDNSSAKDTIEVYVYNAVYGWDTQRDLYISDSVMSNQKFPAGSDYLILDNTYNTDTYSYYCIRYSKNNSKFNITYNSSGKITSKYYFRTNLKNGKNLCKVYFVVIEDGIDVEFRR